MQHLIASFADQLLHEEEKEHENTTSTVERMIWDSKTHLYDVNILKDKLSAVYVGKANHQLDFGCVRSNKPFDLRGKIAFYYEIQIVNTGGSNEKSHATIGLATLSFGLNRQLGSSFDSIGYRGSNGYLYDGYTVGGSEFGPSFGTGDIVGCGMLVESQEIFFTLNGKRLPPPKSRIQETKQPMFAAVSLHSNDESIRANFDGFEDAPFRFDLGGLIQNQKELYQKKLDKVNAPSKAIDQIIEGYFRHFGYLNSLTEYEKSAQKSPSGQSGIKRDHNDIRLDRIVTNERGDLLELRSSIRNCIMQKRVHEAFCLLSKQFPNIEAKAPDLIFHLRILEFVDVYEMKGYRSALEFSRKNLAMYVDVPNLKDTLGSAMALLAYSTIPQDEYIVSNQYRDKVADDANSVILISLHHNPTEPLLQKSMQHLIAAKCRLNQ